MDKVEEAVQFLRNKGVHDLVNVLVEHLVEEKPDDVTDYLIKVLESQKRATGKGPKLMKTLKYGAAAAPEHIGRDPRLQPRSETILPGCVYLKPTRSIIEPVCQRINSASTVGALFATAAAECKAQVNAVIEQCRREGKKFFDESFYFDRRRNMYPKGSPSDCTVTEPKNAMRAAELYPQAPLFLDGVTANDILQGSVGDCFLIGAISALACCTAQHLKPVEKLFVAHDVEKGVYGVCFFKCGGWEWVIVDDYIAVEKQNGRWVPLYAAPDTQPELWPLILEKAYAKVHFNWDMIDGGWAKEAVGDMTGGLEYNLDLYRANRNMKFEEFKALCDDPLTILGCALGNHVAVGGGPSGGAGEQSGVYGLYHGHAYSVLGATKTSDGLCFVRVRNPWGNWAEWKGAWADNAKEWDRNPTAKRELNPTFKEDGAFWMSWDDFRKFYTNIDINRYFPPEWAVLTIFGESPRYDQLATNTYILHVKGRKATTCIVTLAQQDPKSNTDHQLQYANYSKLRLSVYRLDNLPTRFERFIENLDWKFETPQVYGRCIDHQFELEPGYYSLMPQVQYSGVGHYVRVFADASADISLWRYSDGESKALSVSLGVAEGRNAEASVSVTVETGPATPVAGGWSAGTKNLLAKLEISSPAALEARAVAAFKACDRYNYGKLNEKQASDALRTLLSGPTLEKAMASGFKGTDRYSSGYVSQTQFVDICKDLFPKWAAELSGSKV